ncbi:acyltransferase [Flaviaesturariibacter flavus]|uniref:Acyltransferase n=1 Tax=Flaviaesturariibacter flavus TaxID=2502780 RepID=A0A4R1B567_9BACT|nr:acyltransferase [Flaviaesturariibacter flavus]TCJ12630.1 acyltransferase [Flaviaesturariibacter flavus]
MQSLLRPEWSRKMRFFSFVSMVLLVFVHGYDLNDRYLQPFTFVQEKMTVTTFFEYLTANGLFRFRIPMLFAISGYLLALGDSKGYWRIIGKRFRTLAIPLLLWAALGALIAYGLFHWSFTHQSVSNIHMQPTNKNWNQFGWREWRDTILSTNVSYQLWFLRSLFILNLVYPVLRWLSLKASAAWFSYVTLLWVFTPVGMLNLAGEIAGPGTPLGQALFRLHGPWEILLDSEGLLPFCLGIWLCKRGKDLSKTPRWFSMPVFGCLFVGLAVTKTILAFYGDFRNPFAIGAPIWLLHKVVVASGMLVAWFGADRLAAWCLQRRWFRHASDQSFMIYALHVPLITYMIDPVHRLLQGFRYYRLATYLLLPSVIILAAIALGALLKQLAPPVFGILTGNRGLKPLPVPPAAEDGQVRVLAPVTPVGQ